MLFSDPLKMNSNNTMKAGGGLAAPGCVLVDFRPQLLGRGLAALGQLFRYGRGVVKALEQWGILACLDIKVVLTNDGVTTSPNHVRKASPRVNE